MKKKLSLFLCGSILSVGILTQVVVQAKDVSTSQTSEISSSLFLETSDSSTLETSEPVVEKMTFNIKELDLKEVTFIKPKVDIYLDLEDLTLAKQEGLPKKLYTKKLYQTSHHLNYYQLLNQEEVVVGYVEESEVTLDDISKVRQANLNKYVSTINEKTVVYKDEHLTQISNVTLPQYQTYFAKESYVDDTTRKEAVSLFNGEDKLVGYVNKEDLKIADGPQGVYIHNGNYLTINRKTGQTYSDFEGKAKHSFAFLYQKTYRAKGQYNHINGSVFYSLYNDKNEWMGYVPESDVSLVDSPWGEAVKTNKYVSIAKGNYDLWRSFNWVSNGKASRYNHKTFIVKEEYHHFNTSTYAALTDSTGTFYGYINDDALKTVSGPQGEYYHYGKYVTISSSSTNLWRDFNWNVKQPASKIVNQTFQARGIYYHVNGEAYLSVYDNKGVWQGYINKKFVKEANGAQGAYRAVNQYVTITKKNYDLWQNFNWKKKNKSQNVLNQTFLVKGEYRHYNGNTYYSLFNNKNQWMGYINKTATTRPDGAQGLYQSYGKRVTIVKKNYDIWQNFSWKKKGNSNQFYNKQLTARGKYEHFNGSTYYSLYDNKGVWQGYLNANATSLTAEKMKKVQKLLDNKYRTPNMGIYVMSLVDGSTASVNGSQSFVAASTGKLPAMYYSQKMINDKRIDPNKKYKYTDAINQMPYYSYQRDGAGILQGKPYGTSYSIDTMMNWTAKYSDNQGANFLGYYAGRQYDAEMRRDISKIIGRTWVSPFNITAKENALLMEAIYKQNGKLINYMSNTQFDNQRIPKYLPVKVAHKIGDVNSYVHDVAIVYANEPYVLSVMTKNGISYETISKLSKEVYDILK